VIEFSVPPAAIPATARLAVTSGAGAQRVAVWTATNTRHEVCVGWLTGPSHAAPARFTCLRRGLEQPLVEAENGGGLGGVATWGVIAGIASPPVGRLDAETLYGKSTVATLALRAIPSLPGWHSFTTGVLPHPTSTRLEAYDAAGTEFTDGSGALIHPSGPPGGPITPPGQTPTGAPWSDAATNLISLDAATQSTISLALADPAVRSILAANAAWLSGVSSWSNCSSRHLGGIVGFQFVAPASFTATVPAVRPPAGAASYSVVVQSIQATDWHVMAVWVDTNTPAVVGVDTRGVSFPGTTGNKTEVIATAVPARDAGGPDTGTCWHGD
jgi:hypothetical protein